MNNKKVILFAGAAGSGKTPIATYLSYNLNLPIFNNDAIRSEVLEDTQNKILDDELHLKRRNDRLDSLIKSKSSFILDASVDRTWERVKEKLDIEGYNIFLISLDLSEDLLSKTASAKQYTGTAPKKIVDKWFQEHENFRKNHEEEIDLIINDNNYLNRLSICLEKTKKFIKN